MACALERIGRMQPRREGFVEVLADHCRLEDRLAVHQEHRRLAQRRNGQKPVRLGSQVDVVAPEGDAFLVQDDRCALHIGTQDVAREDERLDLRARIRSVHGDKKGVAFLSM